MDKVTGDKVRQVVSSIAKVSTDKLLLDDDLAEKYGIDSLKKVEIIIELEKAFDVTIDDDTALKLRTISHIIDLISLQNMKK